MIGVIDDLGGLLPEVQKFCGYDIFCVTDSTVPEQDLVKGHKMLYFLHWILLRKVNRSRNF